MKKRNQRNTADIINGKKKDQSSNRSTRLEMDGVGSFEVSAFPGMQINLRLCFLNDYILYLIIIFDFNFPYRSLQEEVDSSLVI
jgi:hypothetical protein